MYTYRATVRRIIDGDTIDCDVDMGFRAWRMGERFRLAGINAPETRRPNGYRTANPEQAAMHIQQVEAGRAAKSFVENLIPIGSQITIQTQPDPDNFGRWIATVYVNEKNLNDTLVETGHAVRQSYK